MSTDAAGSGTAVGGGLLSAMALVFAVPFIWVSGGEGVEGISRLFNEGGWPIYAVILTAMIVAALQAVLIAMSAKSPAPALVAPLLPAIPFAVGTGGLYLQMRGAFDAITHVAPADKVTITFAALAESHACLLFGGFCAATLWLGQGAGLALAGSSGEPSRRWPLRVSAVAAVALGAWALTEALQGRWYREILLTAAHVAPMDKPILLADAVNQLAPVSQARLLVVIGGLIAFGAMAAFALSRGAKQVTVSAAAAGLALFIALGGLAMNRLALKQAEELATAAAPADGLVFEGPLSFQSGDMLLDAEGHHPIGYYNDFSRTVERARDRATTHAGDPALIAVRVSRSATTANLRALMGEASSAGVDGLLLLGQPPPTGLQLPKPLEMVRPYCNADVGAEVLFAGEGTPATLAAEGVELEGKLLAFSGSNDHDPEPKKVAVLRGEPKDPAMLVSAVTTLRHAGYRTRLEK